MNDDLLFPIQYDDDAECIENFEEQDVLIQASGGTREPNRSFIGQVISPQRFRSALLIVIAGFFLLLARSASLQILSGEELRALAEQNRLWERTLPAERGIIYDRNGVVLAENEPVFRILVSPESVPDDDRVGAWVQQLSEELDEPPEDLYEAWADREKGNPLLVKEDAPYEFALSLMSGPKNDLGLYVEIATRRSYITDSIPSLSHVLGYTNALSKEEYEEVGDEGYRPFDHIGKQGIEKAYESTLRGTFGKEVIEVDALGSAQRIVTQTDPTNGENITLSVDSQLQSYIETTIENRLEGTQSTNASVIVMDPNTGELLALVSWPAYDANLFTSGISESDYRSLADDERHPLFARAISGEYPSGSTIKPVYAAAALMEGIITPTTTVLSSGGIRVGIWFFPDWRPGGHGLTNVYHAIADSVNTFFYMIGGGYQDFEGLGIERMMDYAARFGFGSETGLDIPGEAMGFLPSAEWKENVKREPWYIGDTYHVAIGQGDFLVTPLQIARSTAVFANGGMLVTPHFNRAMTGNSEMIVDPETVEVVRDAMRETVTSGSAQYLQTVPVAVAGKTGTAQWSTIEPPHSWFTGFAPFDDPEVSITVLIEEGGDEYHAVPIARDVLNWWFSR